MPRQFNIQNLLTAAAELGDHTGYAIAKRTGLGQATISRLVNGKCQPNVTTLYRLADVYPKLMTETDKAAA